LPGSAAVAENFATWTFLLLCVGVTTQLWGFFTNRKYQAGEVAEENISVITKMEKDHAKFLGHAMKPATLFRSAKTPMISVQQIEADSHVPSQTYETKQTPQNRRPRPSMDGIMLINRAHE
jgi:hypothetical protein